MDERALHQDRRDVAPAVTDPNRPKPAKPRTGFRLRIATAACIAACACTDAVAAPLPDKWCEPVGISVVEQDLRHLLGAVARRVGAAVQLTNGVRGHVRGPVDALLPPGRFLDDLGGRYAFNWYLSGGVLYASGADEVAWRVLGLGAARRRSFEAALDGFGLLQNRWPLRYGPRDATVLVSGPPTYVAQVERVLAASAATERRGGGPRSAAAAPREPHAGACAPTVVAAAAAQGPDAGGHHRKGGRR